MRSQYTTRKDPELSRQQLPLAASFPFGPGFETNVSRGDLDMDSAKSGDTSSLAIPRETMYCDDYILLNRRQLDILILRSDSEESGCQRLALHVFVAASSAFLKYENR